jgi:hypothetical protein
LVGIRHIPTDLTLVISVDNEQNQNVNRKLDSPQNHAPRLKIAAPGIYFVRIFHQGRSLVPGFAVEHDVRLSKGQEQRLCTHMSVNHKERLNENNH